MYPWSQQCRQTFKLLLTSVCRSVTLVSPALSHWAHFTVLRFNFLLCITVCCMHASDCDMARWIWWDWSLSLDGILIESLLMGCRRILRRRVGTEVTTQLVLALVTSRLDYCNSVLAALPTVHDRTIAACTKHIENITSRCKKRVLGILAISNLQTSEIYWS